MHSKKATTNTGVKLNFNCLFNHCVLLNMFFFCITANNSLSIFDGFLKIFVLFSVFDLMALFYLPSISLWYHTVALQYWHSNSLLSHLQLKIDHNTTNFCSFPYRRMNKMEVYSRNLYHFNLLFTGGKSTYKWTKKISSQNSYFFKYLRVFWFSTTNS